MNLHCTGILTLTPILCLISVQESYVHNHCLYWFFCCQVVFCLQLTKWQIFVNKIVNIFCLLPCQVLTLLFYFFGVYNMICCSSYLWFDLCNSMKCLSSGTCWVFWIWYVKFFNIYHIIYIYILPWWTALLVNSRRPGNISCCEYRIFIFI